MHTHHQWPITLPFHYFSALERDLTWVASAPLILTPINLASSWTFGRLTLLVFNPLKFLTLLLTRYLSLSSLGSRLQDKDFSARSLFEMKRGSGTVRREEKGANEE